MPDILPSPAEIGENDGGKLMQCEDGMMDFEFGELWGVIGKITWRNVAIIVGIAFGLWAMNKIHGLKRQRDINKERD